MIIQPVMIAHSRGRTWPLGGSPASILAFSSIEAAGPDFQGVQLLGPAQTPAEHGSTRLQRTHGCLVEGPVKWGLGRGLRLLESAAFHWG